MKNRFLSLSLQKKIAILFGSISMVLVLILTLTFSGLMYKNTLDRYKADNAMMTEQIGNTVGNFLSTAENLSTLFVMQSSTQNFAKMHSGSFSGLSMEEYTRYNDMKEFVDSFSGQASGTYFNYIVLFSKNGMRYTAGYAEKALVREYDDIKQSSFYQDIVDNRGKPLWRTVKQDNPLLGSLKTEKVALMRTVIETDRYTESGMLIMFVDIATIRNLYANEFSGDNINILLMDEDGQLVCENPNFPVTYQTLRETGELEHPTQLHSTITRRDGQFLLTQAAIQETGWRVVTVRDMRELGAQFQSVLTVLALVTVLCVILIVVVSQYASAYITKPLQKLTAAMNNYKEGRLEERVSFRYRDEIGELGQGYNEMAERIQSLIVNTYQLELEEKQAQLRVMQSQINPHFLYNTLDSLFWRAQKSDNLELAGDIYALSQFFRLSLNEGNMVSTVGSEKRLIEAYLTLQAKRYRKRIEYAVEIEEAILPCPIPKLILQPFVENAILHGVLKSDEEGRVVVRGWAEGNLLTFEITDNGAGMPSPKVEQLMEIITGGLPPPGYGRGFGMKNVYDRLRIVYGEAAHFQIVSQEGAGTAVHMTFPRQDKMKEQTDNV